MRVSEVPVAPPPELRFRRRIRPSTAVREFWRARGLVLALAERQLRARYKQAFLGFTWAVIPPLLYMVVLTVFVQRIVNIPTGGVPYPLFSYVAIVPWTFFASSVVGASSSILGSMDLINRVYCPRETFPFASILAAAVDGAVSLIALGILFVAYTFLPTATSAWVPLLFSVQVAFTLAVCLIVAALVVYLRDLRHALPVIIQLGFFVTPIAYGMDQIPPSLRLVYSVLDPLAPVIDGYRRTVLYGQPPAWGLLLAGAISSFALLAVGFLLFKRLETGFADIA